jgi:hypothetical protein
MLSRSKAAVWTAAISLSAVAATSAQRARADDADLAKQLSNPVASLISVPFQFNYDCCFGILDGSRALLNIQPVVPIKLNEDWNLIVRTILPLMHLEQTAPGVGAHSGTGDTIQSFFLSPNQPGPGGLIWGVGPVFLWPTASHWTLGAEKWGAGPTLVALKQESGWTYGILANHIWSYASVDRTRPAVSSTFLQPFLNYTWPSTFGITLNSESTYDWVRDQWTIPINLQFSRIFKFGDQPVSLGIGPRYYIETPPNGPRWGVRGAATLLFPVKN